MTNVPTSLAVRLISPPTPYQPTYLPWLRDQLAYQTTSLPTYLPAYLPTCLPAYLPTCLPTLAAWPINLLPTYLTGRRVTN